MKKIMNVKHVGDKMDNVKLISLVSGVDLISQIEEVSSDIGEPDCRLVDPCLVRAYSYQNGYELENWKSDYTSQKIFMIHSDKILTIVDPKPTLLEKYQDFIK
jgi:hypothetical protein